MATLYDPITGLRKTAGRPFAGAGPRLPGDDIAAIGGSPFQNGQVPSGGLSPSSRSYDTLLNLPGTKPDFLGLLNADPILSQFKSGLGAENVADRASRDAAMQRALISFGRVPDFGAASNALGLPGDELAGIADPQTRALASKNTEEGLSTVGRLEREFERVKQNIMDALAARGGLRSGATGIALNDLQQDRKVAESDATTQLVDYLNEWVRGYAEGQRQRARDLAAAQADAAGRIPADQLAGTPASQAMHIGNGIYRKQNGELVNADGTPYTGAPPRSVVDGRIANVPDGYISGANAPKPVVETISGPPRNIRLPGGGGSLSRYTR